MSLFEGWVNLLGGGGGSTDILGWGGGYKRESPDFRFPEVAISADC